MLEVLIATTNKGKVSEFLKLLKNLPIRLKSLQDFPAIPEPLEDGKTFAENAAIKAIYYAKKTNLFALADDSGLEVEMLDNAPGVFSARYSGENASDQSNVEKLLRELETVSSDKRNARFVCEMALATPQGEMLCFARGICTGKISKTVIGNNGFGYDPVFIPEGFCETFGELSADIKQRISHRANAAEKITQKIQDLIQF